MEPKNQIDVENEGQACSSSASETLAMESDVASLRGESRHQTYTTNGFSELHG